MELVDVRRSSIPLGMDGGKGKEVFGLRLSSEDTQVIMDIFKCDLSMCIILMEHLGSMEYMELNGACDKGKNHLISE